MDQLLPAVHLLFVVPALLQVQLSSHRHLHTIRIQQPQPNIISNTKYQRNNFGDDFDLFEATPFNKYSKSSYMKSTTHGKRRTDDEEDEAAELFNKGIPI